MSKTAWGMDPRTNEKKTNLVKNKWKKKKTSQRGQKMDSISHDSSQSQPNP